MDTQKILGATVTPTSVILVTGMGNTMTVTENSHAHYNEIRDAVRVGDYTEAQNLIDLAAEMSEQFDDVSSGLVEIRHGVMYFDNEPVRGVLAERAVQMHVEGFNMDPLFAFTRNLYENPSKRAVDELYGFLEACDLPLTEDGHFLAYKMVKDDYTSIYDGKTDNSVGAVVEMTRNRVDDRANHTCSHGLHFCSQGYLGHYGTGPGHKTMIVKINPRDVVSIPTDYNNAKGRACRYEIIGEFKDRPTPNHSWRTSVATEDRVNRESARRSENSAGVDVMIDGRFEDGDVLYKNDVAERLCMTVDEILDRCHNGDFEYVTNDNDVKLIVWYNNYLELVEDDYEDYEYEEDYDYPDDDGNWY